MHAQKERKKINRCNFLTLTSQCCTIDFPRCLCSCLSFSLLNYGCACRQTNRQTYGQTDRRTDRPKPICPLNFFEVRGIKKSTKKGTQEAKVFKNKTDCTHALSHAHTHARTHIHTYIHILFTKSRGYLDIKNCSTHKNNDTSETASFD